MVLWVRGQAPQTPAQVVETTVTALNAPLDPLYSNPGHVRIGTEGKDDGFRGILKEASMSSGVFNMMSRLAAISAPPYVQRAMNLVRKPA
ncbi:hypothetical protein BH10PSE4_BH10PSE4_34300 [soil metagenome]